MAISILFLVSGFCGLLYQVVWIRFAFAAFGVITPVLSVTISVFMLGLAVGSWAGGRYIAGFVRRTGWSPLVLYAAAEAVIGIGGISVPKLFAAGQALLLPAGEFNSFGYLLLSAVVLGVSILPWCICMGATVPFMMAFMKERSGASARGFSHLYLANVIGAMLGTVVTAVFLIEALGLYKTLFVAAGLNFCMAVTAIVLERSNRRRTPRGADDSHAPIAPSSPVAAPDRPGLSLSILFLTGFVSMAMEVVWTRAFTLALRTTIYAYASILAVYLFATWVGSWLYRLHAREGQVAKTSSLMASLAYLCFLPVALSDPRVLGTFEYFRWTGYPALLLGSIVPFCAALGYLLPKLIDGISQGDPKIAGRAYAVNTVGCIAGPLCAGYALLPLLGVRFSIILLAVPFAGFLIYYFGELWSRRRAYALVSVFLTGLLLAGSAKMFLSFEDTRFYGSAVVRRDHVATVISCGEGMEKRLFVDGVGMTFLTPITKCMAHVPLGLLEKKPESALVICFGMGTTFRSAAAWGIRTTAVELVPGVRDAFGYYFSDAEKVLADPRMKIVVDDGRRFLRRTAERFDVIIIDPPPPLEAAGSSLLYSEEFYRLVKERLNEGGILQQWLPCGEDVIMSAAMRAVEKEFPHVRVFVSLEGWGYHIIASLRPIPVPSAAEFADRLPPAAAKDLVEWNGGETAEGLYKRVISWEIPPGTIMTYGPAISITDDRPFNEYFVVRRMLKTAAVTPTSSGPSSDTK